MFIKLLFIVIVIKPTDGMYVWHVGKETMSLILVTYYTDFSLIKHFLINYEMT